MKALRLAVVSCLAVMVLGGRAEAQVIAGHLSPGIVKADGTVWTWGWAVKNLGTTQAPRLGWACRGPTQVKLSTGAALANVVAIVTGYDASYGYYNYSSTVATSHYLALTADGSVYGWGDNRYNQLGLAGSPPPTIVQYPTKIAGLTKITAISAGNKTSIALRSDGSLWGWGAGYGPQGGAAQTPTRVVDPLSGAPLSHVKAVAAQGDSVLALLDDGTVLAWGASTCGYYSPGCKLPADTAGSVMNNVAAVGGTPSAALRTDALVWTKSGQDGSDGLLHPVPVNDVVAFSQSGWLEMLTADGHAYTSGLGNGFGEQGNGTLYYADGTPAQVLDTTGAPITGIVAVSVTGDASGSSMRALRSDGTLFEWGRAGTPPAGPSTLCSLNADGYLTVDQRGWVVRPSAGATTTR